MEPPTTITVEELAQDVPGVLRRVSQGEVLVVTEGDRQVARIAPAGQVPITPEQRERAQRAVEEMLKLREGNRLEGVTIRELIDEGRRY